MTTTWTPQTGAVGSRLLHAMYNSLIYATAFGAEGDGSTDDADAIQAALDECESRGGGTVILSPGEYKLGKTLLVGEGVFLLGVGYPVVWGDFGQWALISNKHVENADPYGFAGNWGVGGINIDAPANNGINCVNSRNAYFFDIIGTQTRWHFFDIISSKDVLVERCHMTGRTGTTSDNPTTAPYQIDTMEEAVNQYWDGSSQVVPDDLEVGCVNVHLRDTVIDPGPGNLTHPTYKMERALHIHRALTEPYRHIDIGFHNVTVRNFAAATSGAGGLFRFDNSTICERFIVNDCTFENNENRIFSGTTPTVRNAAMRNLMIRNMLDDTKASLFNGYVRSRFSNIEVDSAEAAEIEFANCSDCYIDGALRKTGTAETRGIWIRSDCDRMLVGPTSFDGYTTGLVNDASDTRYSGLLGTDVSNLTGGSGAFAAWPVSEDPE